MNQCSCDCHKTGIQKIEQKLEAQQKEIIGFYELVRDLSELRYINHQSIGCCEARISELEKQRDLGIDRIKKLEEKLSIHQAGLERKWHANTELSNRLNELESKLSQQNPVPDLSQTFDILTCGSCHMEVDTINPSSHQCKSNSFTIKNLAPTEQTISIDGNNIIIKPIQNKKMKTLWMGIDNKSNGIYHTSNAYEDNPGIKGWDQIVKIEIEVDE